VICKEHQPVIGDVVEDPADCDRQQIRRNQGQASVPAQPIHQQDIAGNRDQSCDQIEPKKTRRESACAA
jgi:hypothetical protein